METIKTNDIRESRRTIGKREQKIKKANKTDQNKES